MGPPSVCPELGCSIFWQFGVLALLYWQHDLLLSLAEATDSRAEGRGVLPLLSEISKQMHSSAKPLLAEILNVARNLCKLNHIARIVGWLKGEFIVHMVF